MTVTAAVEGHKFAVCETLQAVAFRDAADWRARQIIRQPGLRQRKAEFVVVATAHGMLTRTRLACVFDECFRDRQLIDVDLAADPTGFE